jgi:hypothetical protein
MAESYQERKKTRVARKKAAEAQVAANKELVATATEARKKAAAFRAAALKKSLAKVAEARPTLDPEKPKIPIVGRQQATKRYAYNPPKPESGKRIPKRITSVVSGGLPGSKKR